MAAAWWVDSVAGSERRMGHSSGPIHDRRPGDVDRAPVVLGRPPLMVSGQHPGGILGRLDDLFGRACVLLTVVFYLIIPLGALLAAVLGS